MLAAALLLSTAHVSLAATVAELNAKTAISEAAGIKAGYSQEIFPPPANPYIPTAADQTNGVVLFQPLLTQWFVGRVPSQEEVPGTLELQGAKGEIEDILLGVYATEAKNGIFLRAKTEAIDKGIEIEVMPLVIVPISRAVHLAETGLMEQLKGTKTFSKVGLWLADNGPVDIKKWESFAWVLRVNIGNKAPSGTFSIPLELTEGEGGKIVERRTLQVKVLPFEIIEPADAGYTFGVFSGGMPSSETEFRQLKTHGIDSIQWFMQHWCGIKFNNENGKLVLHFDEMDDAFDKFKKSGMRGPLIPSGNGSKDGFFRFICKAMGKPVDDETVKDDPEVQNLFVEGFRQLFDRAAEQKYPEIVWLPNDEPTRTVDGPTRMNRHRRTVKLLRENFPKIRIYGVCMDRVENAEKLLDCDILVCNGDFDRIVHLGKEKQKSVWYYRGVCAAMGYEAARFQYGVDAFRHGVTGRFFWCLNYPVGDPYNDFDTVEVQDPKKSAMGSESSAMPAWPPLKKGGPMVESIAFEGMRDGVNDVRYALTLEKLLAEKKGAKADQINADYRSLKKSAMGRESSVRDVREKLTEWIIQMMQD